MDKVVCWEWEQKRNQWVRYDKNSLEKITEAVRNKQNAVKFIINNVDLTLHFDSMTQKNETTGFQRKIRCVIECADGSFCCWEWENEKKSWISYPSEVLLALEKAYQNNDTNPVSITACERSYEIDLTKMEQQNSTTGVTRKVHRALSSGQSAGVASPAPLVRVPTRALSKRVVKQESQEFSNGTTAKEESGEAKQPPPKKAKSELKKEVTAKSQKSDSKAQKSAKSAASSKKTVVVKGKAPVDPECYAKLGVAHVYFEGAANVYDAMLNQTNVQNNNNKYYVIQLLEDDAGKRYSVWFRWGRVGFKGQSNLVACGPDLDEAKRVFCQKFADKTKNEWADRQSFRKVPGKYDLIKMDYSVKEQSPSDQPAVSSTEAPVKKEPPPSVLDQRIQDLLNLICDIKAMEQAVIELEYDAEKAPLGKLTTDQIKAGYLALKKIESCIEKEDFGPKLVEACNQYYTRVPHCFGMRKPPLIRDREALQHEVELIEALGEIEVAIRTLQKEEGDLVVVAPVDAHYNGMKCKLEPLEHESDEFKLIEKYMLNTHAATHSLYKMKPRQIFACQKEGEESRFNDLGNRMLLWHGSRLSNWYGILSGGLRVAPPEAPSTGYMFGKGVYFADVSSKSANYCFPTPRHPTGLLLLCEVSLGKSRDLLAADYKADRLSPGYGSVKGLGKLAPDPDNDVTMPDGCLVPTGKPKQTGITNPKGYTLNYNEFVVYDTAQIKARYLVHTDFLFS